MSCSRVTLSVFSCARKAPARLPPPRSSSAAIVLAQRPRWCKAAGFANMAGEISYHNWTKPGLIQRLKDLEDELKRRPAAQQAEAENGTLGSGAGATSPSEPAIKGGGGGLSRSSTRYIALKLAYLGKNYGGFEYSASASQPSIEEELWNALTVAHLISPDDDRVMQWECCDYSKCGRTDRGVSAFGQVIALRVRSNRPLPKKRVERRQHAASATEQDAAADEKAGASEDETEAETEMKPFDHIADELCYPRILNRILPSDIRILAWCPSPPPDFSARFSCRERQYRYFFTQPAFGPAPTPPLSTGDNRVKSGWLDIEAMRDAAKRFEGEHDFRNFCKVDGWKQLTDFSRHIFESDIVEVAEAHSTLPYLGDANFAPPGVDAKSYPKVYYFHVRGSAFLWHQIRHMVAVLFLVGQGLEAPALVSQLLDVDQNPRKPGYLMADGTPLVLWDCIFPEGSAKQPMEQPTEPVKDSLEWIYDGDGCVSEKFGQFGLMHALWQTWRGRKMDELLSHQLLQQVSQLGTLQPTDGQQRHRRGKPSAGVRLFHGGDGARQQGKYVPALKSKTLLPTPEEQNDKYARRKGYKSAAEMRTKRGLVRGKEEPGEVGE